eukprot:541601_1
MAHRPKLPQNTCTVKCKPNCHRMLDCELLIFGYIRQHHNTSIPVALIDLCLLFFAKIFRWNLKHTSLKHNECIQSNLFKIKELLFQCILTKLNDGRINVCFAIKSKTMHSFLPHFIRNIVCNYQILCYNRSKPNLTPLSYSGILHFICRRSYRLYNHEACIYMMDKYDEELSFDSFCCDLDILQIEYRTYSGNYPIQPLHSRIPGVILYKTVSGECKLHETLLTNFRPDFKRHLYINCGPPHRGLIYFGPQINDNKFNEMWRIAFAPNMNRGCAQFWEPNGKLVENPNYYPDGTNILIILRRISSLIKFIHTKIEINVIYYVNMIYKETNKRFSSYYVCGKVAVKLDKDIESIHDMTFKIKIEVLQLIDKNDNVIPEHEWNDYGCVSHQITNKIR